MVVILKLRIAEGRRALRGWDHFWTVIRSQGENGKLFTARSVAMQCQPGVDADVRDYVRRLIRAGIAARVDGKVRLLKRPRATPSLRRDGTPFLQARGPQQMWNVMRREIGGFTLQQLAIDATTDEVSVTRRAAESYCRSLLVAGLLVDVGTTRTPVYRLKGSANTGPLPPAVLRSSLVYDRNLEVILGEPEIEAEEAGQ